MIELPVWITALPLWMQAVAAGVIGALSYYFGQRNGTNKERKRSQRGSCDGSKEQGVD
jgi:hypothetical protein